MTARSRRNEVSLDGDIQFDSEIAAPVFELRTPTGTGANSSNRECEWKQGDSAAVEERAGYADAMPPVGWSVVTLIR